MIPWLRIDEVDEQLQLWQRMSPDLIRDTLIELIRCVNELEQRVKALEQQR